MTLIRIKNCPVCGGEKFSSSLPCRDNLVSKEIFSIYFCDYCHFGFTQDFPSENEIGKYYETEEYISHSDTQKGIINSLYHLARKISLKSKMKLISKVSSVNSGRLLDIGAGTGYFLNQMKEAKWIVTGIEKSDSARSYAKKKFGLDFQDSEYLFDLQQQTKDVVTMWHVLEHIEKLEETLSHIYKILKNNGIAVIALPNKDSLDARHYKQDWAAYDVPRHLWHFSPSDFSLLADKHGFRVEKMRPMHFDGFYISMLSEKNKHTFLASFIGLIKGGLFFLRSFRNTEKCSSVIYILKKK